MPPAWSSLPEIGLNLASTNPSLMASSVFAAQQNVASPDCFNTLPRDGAVSSATTSHLAAPLPVMPDAHPIGRALVSSKLTLVCDMTMPAAANDRAITSVHLISSWKSRQEITAALLNLR